MLRSQSIHLLDEPEHPTTTDRTDQCWDLIETRRRIWWCSFLIDRFTAIADGRPGMLDTDDCRVIFPEDDQGHEGSEFDKLESIQPRRLMWRARVVQLAELLLQATLLLKQINAAGTNTD